ncbi:SOS response-associated peptidase [Synechococcus sp. MIT S9503]|uniref:SOS response-associated peptidase n=1 Tax=Synechococcus sp. MIT S9503 TaxID=3082547 RepID=UPI0039A70D7A|tara:strand:+ start:186 stop:827 length:642 start_codon:yes stop_codon:yes gene_type:complete
MCGRFALSTPLKQLPSVLQHRMDREHQDRYAERDLIVPGEPLLAFRSDQSGPEASLMLWGLIPGWQKDPAKGPRPFNARAETVAEKPSFRGAWRHRRCLLPASCFFEKGRAIRRIDRHSFWLAGLWERWLGGDGSEVDTCTILTTTPNDLVRPLHQRMPVVIPEGLEEAWMAPVHGQQLRALEPLLAPWDPSGWEVVNKQSDGQLSLLSGLES